MNQGRFLAALVTVVASCISVSVYGQNLADNSGMPSFSILRTSLAGEPPAEPVAAPPATPALVPAPAPTAVPSVASTATDSDAGLSSGTPWFQRFMLPVPEATGPVDDWLCCTRPGVLGNVDYLNWMPRRSGMDFASFVSETNPTTTPVATQSLDFDRASGFRAGLGYRFATGWDVVWTYTYYLNENTETATASGVNPELLASQSYLSNGPLAKVPVTSVQADGSLLVNIQDVEAEWTSCLNDTVGFKAFGGFRWAKIDQNFNSTYSYAAGTGSVSLPNNMDAEGIRLGAEFQWRSCYGVRVFGQLAESILVADFQTRQTENDPAAGISINTSGDTAVMVPVFESAVGVTYDRGPWEFRAGYEMSDWFNMVQVNRSAQSLLLDGYFLSLSFSR